MTPEKSFLVRMDADLHAAVVRASEREDRSMAAIVRESLRAYVRSAVPKPAVPSFVPRATTVSGGSTTPVRPVFDEVTGKPKKPASAAAKAPKGTCLHTRVISGVCVDCDKSIK